MSNSKLNENIIDKDKFEYLVKLGLSNEEIVDFFMTNSAKMWSWIKKTYNTKRPLVILKKMRTEGKIDFLVKQRKLAEKIVVSIWLGKNYYSQTDEKVQDNANDYEDLNPLSELLKDDIVDVEFAKNQEKQATESVEKENVKDDSDF